MKSESHIIVLLRYKGTPPTDSDGDNIAFVKDGYYFAPSEDPNENYVNGVFIEKANKWVSRWPEDFEFVKAADRDAESVVAKLMDRIKELEAKLEETPKPKKKVKDDDK